MKALLISEADAWDLIDFGSVYVEGRQERNASRRLAGTEEIRVCWPRKGTLRTYEIDPSRILFEDRYALAYNKEAGIPSQQTPSDGYNNLFAALYRYLKRKEILNPYVALHHRLDQETSGVMILALDRAANRNLGNAFMHRSVVKEYLAWVAGNPSSDEWICDQDIGRKDSRYRSCPKGQGKPAQTSFRVVSRTGLKEQALVLAHPHTGRTHQIRLHLAASGHPVLGDGLYGGPPAPRLYLHAWRLTLPHPVKRSELVLTAPVPPEWPPFHPMTIPD